VSGAPSWPTKRRGGRASILPKPPTTLTERRAHAVGRKIEWGICGPIVAQSAESGRSGPGHDMSQYHAPSSRAQGAPGRAASRRALSSPGDRGRAGLGQDSALEDAPRWSIPMLPRFEPCRARSAISSSPPTTAMYWHLTTSRPCRRGSRMRFAGWPAEAALRSISSTPTRTRCCSMLLARSSSTASRMWSAVRISPTAPRF
jgi:hypothetical protein